MSRSNKIHFQKNTSSGVSRLEVVLTLVVVLFVLDLMAPALCRIREDARRNECSEHLHLLGQALQAFQEVNGHLPTAAKWGTNGIELTQMPFTADSIPVSFQNWAIDLLPYINHEAEHNEFDISQPIVGEANTVGRNLLLRELKCPSDAYNTRENSFLYTDSHQRQIEFARGNYALNGGTQFIMKGPGTLMEPRPLVSTVYADPETRDFRWWGEGVGGFNKWFSIKEFTNGLSTTVALNEIRAGIDPTDCRGVWALGQVACSVTWGHGIMSDAGGPNPTLENADDILNGSIVHRVIGAERIKEERMSFCDHCNNNTQASSRSMHPGGVNLVFCDGRVRFVGDNVDQSIWHTMHSRNTPREVLSDISADLITGGRSLERREVVSGPVAPIKDRDTKGTLANSLGMRFSLVPAGKFTMGLPDEEASHNYSIDVPPHEVAISRPLFMGQHEVTQSEYEQVMGNNPSYFTDTDMNGSKLSDSEAKKRPVENVSWYDAVEFCKKLSVVSAEKESGRAYRLPTEAEWEYCCRSGSTKPYRFVREWNDRDDSGEIAKKMPRKDPPPTMPVGSYRPNAFGLYDMRGNVWEWCSDWFRHDYYSWSSAVDPPGSAEGMLKVYRGCDWIYSGDECKTENRCLSPYGKSRFIGFRVVCDVANAEMTRN